MKAYSKRRVAGSRRHNKSKRLVVIIIGLIAIGAIAAYFLFFRPTPAEEIANHLQFDGSVTSSEQQTIISALQEQSKNYRGTVDVSVRTSSEISDNSSTLSVYVPVTNKYASRQQISQDELSGVEIYLPQDTDGKIRQAVSDFTGISSEKIQSFSGEISEDAVAFIPASELSSEVKLLSLDNSYYLDNFTKGGLFRQAAFNGGSSGDFEGLVLNNLPTKENTLKVNMSGVTALTRGMIKKLESVGDANYFSEKIGPFLADADITHVSNEVSFQQNCPYSYAVFCSPPGMIEALKSSGVDLVEITGNHNNDVGSQYNTETINQYHSLGWATFGGGLNADEAAKPYVADKKGSKVAFLGYNFADAPNSGAIATSDGAGANGWDSAKVKSDIEAAKQQADFVVVDIQYWECYSYPDGYVEYPECDSPIGQQAATFREAADYGADMVIGSSAHQPQTYEVYNGVPIYYGLGNLYFDQTQWPGTERGIILTHYFQDGKLAQTKLTPTVYDNAYQTHIMSNDDALYLLDRLKTARQNSL